MDAYIYNFNIPWVFVEISQKRRAQKRRGLRLTVCFRGRNLGGTDRWYTLEETNMEPENRRMLTSSKPIRFYVHLWGACRVLSSETSSFYHHFRNRCLNPQDDSNVKKSFCPRKTNRFSYPVDRNKNPPIWATISDVGTPKCYTMWK